MGRQSAGRREYSRAEQFFFLFLNNEAARPATMRDQVTCVIYLAFSTSLICYASELPAQCSLDHDASISAINRQFQRTNQYCDSSFWDCVKPSDSQCTGFQCRTAGNILKSECSSSSGTLCNSVLTGNTHGTNADKRTNRLPHHLQGFNFRCNQLCACLLLVKKLRKQ